DVGERVQPGPRHVYRALDDAGQILLDLVGKPDVPACVLSSLVSSHDAGSEGACDFADLEDFELIAHLDIVVATQGDRKSTRLNSSHVKISYAVFCLKKKKKKKEKLQ